MPRFKEVVHRMSNSSNPYQSTRLQKGVKKLYVGNLSWDVTWQDLKDHFKQVGNVLRADILMDAGRNRSKGCGIVEYERYEEAQAAINRLNDTELKGRLIYIREDREDGDQGGNGAAGSGNNRREEKEVVLGNPRVYVGNLAWDVEWQDLKDHFKPIGHVNYADVMKENGRSKGCGIVEFSSPEEAMDAIQAMTNTQLKGRLIYVREDRESIEAHKIESMGRNVSSVIATGMKRLYVGNVGYDVTWQDLKDLFKQAGSVVRSNIIVDPVTGRSKGCAIIEMATSDDALKAVELLNDVEVRGRKIFIREDREAREQYRQPDSQQHQQQQHQQQYEPQYNPNDRVSVTIGQHAGRHVQVYSTDTFHIPNNNHNNNNHNNNGKYADGGRPPKNCGPTVFVGNLDWNINWQDLKDHFREIGGIIHVDVAADPSTGRSKGYGTVEFNSGAEAADAISKLHNSTLGGRQIIVREDRS